MPSILIPLVFIALRHAALSALAAAAPSNAIAWRSLARREASDASRRLRDSRLAVGERALASNHASHAAARLVAGLNIVARTTLSALAKRLPRRVPAVCGVAVVPVAIDPDRVCDGCQLQVEPHTDRYDERARDLHDFADPWSAYDADPYKLIAIGAPRGVAESRRRYARTTLLPPARRRRRIVERAGVLLRADHRRGREGHSQSLRCRARCRAGSGRVMNDAEVLATLRASRVEGDRLLLPPGQLPRKLYERTDEVLRALGGRWCSRSRAHRFERDPSEALSKVLDDGAVATARDLGWFPTPAALARALVERAAVTPGARVLEPSAGKGAIVEALLCAGAEVTAIEIEPRRVERLRARFPQVTVVEDDFCATEPHGPRGVRGGRHEPALQRRRAPGRRRRAHLPRARVRALPRRPRQRA